MVFFTIKGLGYPSWKETQGCHTPDSKWKKINKKLNAFDLNQKPGKNHRLIIHGIHSTARPYEKVK